MTKFWKFFLAALMLFHFSFAFAAPAENRLQQIMGTGTEIGEVLPEALSRADYYEILNYKNRLTNLAVRKWYVGHAAHLAQYVDQSAPLEQRAHDSVVLRNALRIHARRLMADIPLRDRLNRIRPNVPFEQLLQSKMDRKHMTREEALHDLLRTSGKTNERVNQHLLGGKK